MSKKIIINVIFKEGDYTIHGTQFYCPADNRGHCHWVISHPEGIARVGQSKWSELHCKLDKTILFEQWREWCRCGREDFEAILTGKKDDPS